MTEKQLTGRRLTAPGPRPRPVPREALVLDAPPLAQIDIYDDHVVLVRRQGRRWRSYPVTPEGLVSAFGGLPTSTGMLPPGCIAVGSRAGDPFYVLLLPARRWTLAIDAGDADETLQVPLPPLVWAGWRRDYRVFAVSGAGPVTEATVLAHAPLSNVFGGGGICWGDVRTEAAAAGTVRAMLDRFFGSRFNNHADDGKSVAHPRAVLAQLRAVAAAGGDYPLDDLVPAGRTVGELVRGSIWGGYGY